MGEACGAALKPEALARVLDGRGMLARREDGRRLSIRYIAGLGKGHWYALSRTAIGRTAAPGPTLKAHEGGRS